MPIRFTFPTALATAAILAPAIAFAEPDADTVVARVNGQDITIGHMVIATATLPQQYQQLPAEVLYNAILDQLIQQTVLQQSFGDEEPRHVAISLENERRALLAAEEIEAIMKEAASDEDIKAAYDAKYADGFGGEEYNASHILVETEDEAKAVKTQLDEGADFAETAKSTSTGPSGPNGGELGWFGLGAMVPEFEAAVTALEPGTISDPVQTQFGWHIVKLNEKRMAEAPALEQVRDEIAEEVRQKVLADRLEQLVGEAEVERPEVEGVDPEILRDLSIVRN